MNRTLSSGRAVLLLGLLAMNPVSAGAAAQDYEFTLLKSDIRQSRNAMVELRMTDRRSGAPVSDAIIFNTALDMAPDGMPDMGAAIEPVGSSEPGVYHFKADLSMVGAWRLRIGAMIQGEPEPVERDLILKVSP
ncbi:FixH family protein [Agrobacterium sp. Ap1]|jgi:hypothetical protein|uniref:FixH family protein n=1 Tax=Rhizobium/Agrobacterium group TaxID=227290 RepID=UPI00160E5A65|nr:FixH family protein [Agrobacterium sp. Ap1]MBO0142585.1 FixH family protein [Agrobacterium sp. Ap1]